MQLKPRSSTVQKENEMNRSKKEHSALIRGKKRRKPEHQDAYTSNCVYISNVQNDTFVLCD